MPKLLQVSIEVNSGSVGRIAEQIGEIAIAKGWDSYITYARNHLPSLSKLIKIGNMFDVYAHGLRTRLLDDHGFGSSRATKELIERIREIKPDVILLHHLHGYFINIEILFSYLSSAGIPVIWVQHDCWSITGHCAYFDFVGCEKWKTGCFDCEQKKQYPKTLWVDRSMLNYEDKRRVFTSVSNMTIVTVSHWLASVFKESFLRNYPVRVIHNGIDVAKFYPRSTEASSLRAGHNLGSRFVILGVASTWEPRKGLTDFFKLSKELDPDRYAIILIGLNKKQLANLPKGIIGIERTGSVDALAAYYTLADVFFNPTWEEALGMTNLEAMACGTPVVTYRSGGSPESLPRDLGVVVERGAFAKVAEFVGQNSRLNGKTKQTVSDIARLHVCTNFNKELQFMKYIELFDELRVH